MRGGVEGRDRGSGRCRFPAAPASSMDHGGRTEIDGRIGGEAQGIGGVGAGEEFLQYGIAVAIQIGKRGPRLRRGRGASKRAGAGPLAPPRREQGG